MFLIVYMYIVYVKVIKRDPYFFHESLCEYFFSLAHVYSGCNLELLNVML